MLLPMSFILESIWGLAGNSPKTLYPPSLRKIRFQAFRMHRLRKNFARDSRSQMLQDSATGKFACDIDTTSAC